MRVQHRRDARVPRIATRVAKKITTDLSTTRLPLHPFPSSPKWHIPACGVSLLFGNFYYAWLATRLATKENRTNVTAQPYGLNTTVIFIILYGMCLPALEAAADKFAPDATATDAEMHSAARQAAEYGWKVSVAANFIIGVFEMCGFFLGDLIRWAIPTAAVYIPLAGVGFVYLAFSPMISIAKEPMMCFLPLVVVVVGFFGNVRYPLYGKITIPVAFLAIAIATISGWAGACQHSRETITYGFGSDAVSTSVAEFYNGKDPLTDLPYKTCTGTDPTRAEKAYNDFAFKGDILGGFGKGLAGLGESELMGDWVAPSLLFGIIGFLGTMACVESAEAAGDSYPMAECMIADGLGTCIGALSGGMFPTTVYIGYPVYKALGAKIGYSMLNGVSYFILLSTGLFAALYNVIPGCANSAILVFVGLLLSRQAFEETPPRHYPCLLLGLMPFICNYMALDSDGHHSVNMGVQMMAPGGGAVFASSKNPPYSPSSPPYSPCSASSPRTMTSWTSPTAFAGQSIRRSACTTRPRDATTDGDGPSRGRSAPRFSRVTCPSRVETRARSNPSCRRASRTTTRTRTTPRRRRFRNDPTVPRGKERGESPKSVKRTAQRGEARDDIHHVAGRAPIARASEVCNSIIRVLRVHLASVVARNAPGSERGGGRKRRRDAESSWRARYQR